MAVFNGKGNDDNLWHIGRADTDQVESGIVVRFADNEIPGIGALGGYVEIVFMHRLYLTPHAPATVAMTLNDSSRHKCRKKQGLLQTKPAESYILPNSRTLLPSSGHLEGLPVRHRLISGPGAPCPR